MCDIDDITIIVEDNTTELVVEINNLNGLSAYQVALENGFIGTEQEWLDSLKCIIDTLDGGLIF